MLLMEILTITRDRECVSLNCHRHKYAQILPAAFHTFDLSPVTRAHHHPLLLGGILRPPVPSYFSRRARFRLNEKPVRAIRSILELINGDKEGRPSTNDVFTASRAGGSRVAGSLKFAL